MAQPTKSSILKLKFHNNILNALKAEKLVGRDANAVDSRTRMVKDAHYAWAHPLAPRKPKLISTVPEMLQKLGLEVDEAFTDVLSGKRIPPNITPWAYAYGGHQFGYWAGQLGDGRAMSICQGTSNGELWELQLKGCGPTAFSRNSDGLAVLRSSIREYLAAEAMHGLGVPTSRSVALIVIPNRMVEREVLETGAVVTRCAPGWIRFGNFELFYARQDIVNLKLLADYTMQAYFGLSNGQYDQFLARVVEKTADMIAGWQAVGFCHGVMNTDNFSVLGITIDYGPFQFLDVYDPQYVCNHSDTEGRYSFNSQPDIGLWNLARLASALSPLLSANSSEMLTDALKKYAPRFKHTYRSLMSKKFGFHEPSEVADTLIEQFLNFMSDYKMDYTLSLRAISNAELGTLDTEILELLRTYCTDRTSMDTFASRLNAWWLAYNQASKSGLERTQLMLKSNPKFVMRNSVTQNIIEQAESGDYSGIDEYLNVLKSPFQEGTREQVARFGQPVAPTELGLKCSCSS